MVLLWFITAQCGRRWQVNETVAYTVADGLPRYLLFLLTYMYIMLLMYM